VAQTFWSVDDVREIRPGGWPVLAHFARACPERSRRAGDDATATMSVSFCCERSAFPPSHGTSLLFLKSSVKVVRHENCPWKAVEKDEAEDRRGNRPALSPVSSPVLSCDNLFDLRGCHVVLRLIRQRMPFSQHRSISLRSREVCIQITRHI